LVDDFSLLGDTYLRYLIEDDFLIDLDYRLDLN